MRETNKCTKTIAFMDKKLDTLYLSLEIEKKTHSVNLVYIVNLLFRL